MDKKKYVVPLLIMLALFFMFGFITTMNNSTIEFLKSAFGLNTVEKQLPNTFFYGAYALSIPIGYLLVKIGYRNGILFGLALISTGFFLSVPAIGFGYYTFLGAIFVFAIGVTMVQVAAQPYVAILGTPETAESRLTLANALNSVATVIAPIFVALLLQTQETQGEGVLSNAIIQSIVKVPFWGIACATLVLLALIALLKIPEITAEDNLEKTSTEKVYKSSAFQYTHVWLGFIGIFVYLAIEVGVPSFFADFAIHKGLKDLNSTDLLKFYWGGLMVGRIVGVFVLKKFSSNKILYISSLAAGVVLLAAVFSSGYTAVYLFLGTGLFHSIMFPVIFSLALKDLGPHTKVASGIIATAVIGAAILMPIMGAVQTATGSVIAAVSFLFIYYIYLVYFAQKGARIR